MKDLYSFSKNEKEHAIFYEKAKIAYKNIFDRVGIGDKTYITFASGGTFSKYSHEFQTVCDAGEDTIHICDKCKVAVNAEIFEEQSSCPSCGNEKLEMAKSIEVGNIFSLGTKFSSAFELEYLDEMGKKNLVVMGSYGIGPGRVMGTVVELLSDKSGIVWPKSISPFSVHLISIGKDAVSDQADKIYEDLKKKNIDVLYDDREARPGEKFTDSDLMGIPVRVVVSEKTIKEGGIEIKLRNEDKSKIISEKELLNTING